jgi:hypothetical protein
MSAPQAQLPDGLAVAVVDIREFTRNPARSLRTAREGVHVVIVSGHTGRPVAYLTADPPGPVAPLVPALSAELSAAVHAVRSRAATAREARRAVLAAANERRAAVPDEHKSQTPHAVRKRRYRARKRQRQDQAS